MNLKQGKIKLWPILKLKVCFYTKSDSVLFCCSKTLNSNLNKINENVLSSKYVTACLHGYVCCEFIIKML